MSFEAIHVTPAARTALESLIKQRAPGTAVRILVDDYC